MRLAALLYNEDDSAADLYRGNQWLRQKSAFSARRKYRERKKIVVKRQNY